MGFWDYVLIVSVLAAAIGAICFLAKRKGGCSGCAGCAMAEKCKKISADFDCNRRRADDIEENDSGKGKRNRLSD